MSNETGIVISIGQEDQVRQVFVGTEARAACHFLGQLIEGDNLPDVDIRAFQYILEHFEPGFEMKNMLDNPRTWQKLAVGTWWLAGQFDLPTFQNNIVVLVRDVYTQCLKAGEYNRVSAESFEILPRNATHKQIEHLFIAFHAGLLLNAKVSGERLDQELRRVRRDVADEIRSAMFSLEAGLSRDLIKNEIDVFGVVVAEISAKEGAWNFGRLHYPEIVVVHPHVPTVEEPPLLEPTLAAKHHRLPTALPTPPPSRTSSVAALSAAVSLATVDGNYTPSSQPEEECISVRARSTSAATSTNSIDPSVSRLQSLIREKPPALVSRASSIGQAFELHSDEAATAPTEPASNPITSSGGATVSSASDTPVEPTPAAAVPQPAVQVDLPLVPDKPSQTFNFVNVHVHNVAMDRYGQVPLPSVPWQSEQHLHLPSDLDSNGEQELPCGYQQSRRNGQMRSEPMGLQQHEPAPPPALHVPGISSQDPVKNVSVDLDMFTNMMNSLRVGAAIPPADSGLSEVVYQSTPSMRQQLPPPADSGYSGSIHPEDQSSPPFQLFPSPASQRVPENVVYPSLSPLHDVREEVPRSVIGSLSQQSTSQSATDDPANISSLYDVRENVPPSVIGSLSQQSTLQHGTVATQSTNRSLRPRRVQQIVAQSTARRPRPPAPARKPQELRGRQHSWTGTTLSKYTVEPQKLEETDHYPLTYDNLSAGGVAPVAPGNTINAHEVEEASDSASTTPIGNWIGDVARSKRFEYSMWSWKTDGVKHLAKKVKNGVKKVADEQAAEYANAHTPDPTRTFSKMEAIRNNIPDLRIGPRKETIMSDDVDMDPPPKGYSLTTKPLNMQALEECYAQVGVTAGHQYCVRCLEKHGAEHRANWLECAKHCQLCHMGKYKMAKGVAHPGKPCPRMRYDYKAYFTPTWFEEHCLLDGKLPWFPEGQEKYRQVVKTIAAVLPAATPQPGSGQGYGSPRRDDRSDRNNRNSRDYRDRSDVGRSSGHRSSHLSGNRFGHPNRRDERRGFGQGSRRDDYRDDGRRGSDRRRDNRRSPSYDSYNDDYTAEYGRSQRPGSRRMRDNRRRSPSYDSYDGEYSGGYNRPRSRHDDRRRSPPYDTYDNRSVSNHRQSPGPGHHARGHRSRGYRDHSYSHEGDRNRPEPGYRRRRSRSPSPSPRPSRKPMSAYDMIKQLAKERRMKSVAEKKDLRAAKAEPGSPSRTKVKKEESDEDRNLAHIPFKIKVEDH
ncbi:hypothetical protein K491DRAFT_681730 [Lophiostoma macrostomum CBS 122681]|uniref:Uncharacterized protein n=1 Tax=Lophiostoma macrostomum CBS 122681 TaxID=1314788 RepID=A0A6A6SZQ9_9PLEO|nr:hypothetical protein K491DRAFT_681730 [Lophiostoma macrostomum CBS 122681]